MLTFYVDRGGKNLSAQAARRTRYLVDALRPCIDADQVPKAYHILDLNYPKTGELRVAAPESRAGDYIVFQAVNDQ